jgi:hypothetical protein
MRGIDVRMNAAGIVDVLACSPNIVEEGIHIGHD